jgi:hypothetical protein
MSAVRIAGKHLKDTRVICAGMLALYDPHIYIYTYIYIYIYIYGVRFMIY